MTSLDGEPANLVAKGVAENAVRTASVSPVLSGNAPRPFVKWAGGKGQHLEKLSARSPLRFKTYYEPFLGGGALFFHLYRSRVPFKAVLSDANEELITAYRVVKSEVDELILRLKEHQKNFALYSKEYYYSIRDCQKSLSDIERASRLLFLNKTCYNGLYRVNRRGKFNVPFGSYKKPRICDENNLRAASSALQSSSAELVVADYEEAIKNAEEGDYVYFDPPYHPISSTANFTAYTDSGFTLADQRRLAQVFDKLDNRRCQIVLSNSDVPEIRKMYSKFHVNSVESLRAINCVGGKRRGHAELIISNY